MFRHWDRRGLLLFACALLAGGCSAADGHRDVTARHHGGIRLSPDPAVGLTNVTVVFDDEWLDPAKCTYEWRRNGMLIPNASTHSLAPDLFTRGDRIGVVVSLPDSAGNKGRQLEAQTRVVNSPPRVLRASLLLTTASGRAEILTSVECADPDGDHPTFEYRWFRNGTLVEGATGVSVPAAGFARGDRAEVEVVASDGESKSPPMRSEALRVENRPPQFTSQPSSPAPAADAFRYQAVATDPDGDALHYELVHGPVGMTVDAGGAVYWSLPTGIDRDGEFAVGLKAVDSAGGEATQEFSIHLTPAPAPAPTPASTPAPAPKKQ